MSAISSPVTPYQLLLKQRARNQQNADVTFSALTANQTFTLAGITVTASANGATAANLAAAFASKAAGASLTNGNELTFTGNLTGYTSGTATGAVVRFTSTTASSNVGDLTATGTDASTVAIVHSSRRYNG
jgi:hypothetical protein